LGRASARRKLALASTGSKKRAARAPGKHAKKRFGRIRWQLPFLVRSVPPMQVRDRFVNAAGALVALALMPGNARADDTIGAPPPDAKAFVAAPKAAEDVPVFANPKDETTATASAGGQVSTGNSQLAAATANGQFAMRRGADGFGASLLGNYGEGAPHGQSPVDTTENLQGRLRYDRFTGDRFSFFLIGTGRHDRFQGLIFRLNVDPGAKYLFVNSDATKLWGEVGYDFQYDVRLGSAIVGPPVLDKTAADHSARAFVGFKHAFNKEVSVTTGLEYLQSFVKSDSAGLDYDSRINYDLLFAAQVGGGLAVGLGFGARYDSNPLPSKANLDTSSTFSLIYSFSETPASAAIAAAATPAPCPTPPPPAPVNPPPAPPAASTMPAPSAAPVTMPPPVSSPPAAPPQ